MMMLCLGLLLFTGTHLVLSLAPGGAEGLRAKIGVNGVKGLVALLSLAGLVLIVLGWRSSEIVWLYTPPAALRYPGLLLIALGLYLFVVSNRPSAIKRRLRHPQLSGVLLWSLGHLMLNGENRAVLLFAWLGIWAVHEIILINRRDGAWVKPESPPLATDMATAVIALVVIIALAWAHPWLAGVPVAAGL